MILGNKGVDATMYSLIKDGNKINISSDGFIGAVEMIIEHGLDFSIDLTDESLISKYNTNAAGNQTHLMIVAPKSEELLSITGSYEIKELYLFLFS